MLGARAKASQHIADGVISVAFEAFSRDFERHHRDRGDHGADNEVCEVAGILIAPTADSCAQVRKAGFAPRRKYARDCGDPPRTHEHQGDLEELQPLGQRPARQPRRDRQKFVDPLAPVTGPSPANNQ
jgi:hypothetical protein